MTHSCDVNAKHSAGELSPFRYESVRNCLERERAPATAEEGFHKSLETPQGSLSAFIYKSQAALESDEVVDVPSKFPPRVLALILARAAPVGAIVQPPPSNTRRWNGDRYGLRCPR